MSGLLRRIKRSRTADAGEPLPEGQAAAPEGAAPATEPATAVTEPVAEEPQREPEPKTQTPVLLADPNTPADVDPAALPMRPPAGRRGRLRRRLRYLRRARELMLRDLGGLLYEIHRTGGGNVEAHGNIVRAKIQRITGLDAEAHALETALAAARAEAIVFQPGVGGACPACGEYYGSAARFCSHCGTSLAGAVLAAPAPDAAATPAPASRESVFGRPSQGLSSGDPLRTSAPGSDQPTAALASAGAQPAADEPGPPQAEDRGEGHAALAPVGERAAEEEPGAAGATEAEDAPSSSDPAGAGDEPAATGHRAGDDDGGAPAETAAAQDVGAPGQPATSDDAAAIEAAPSDAPAEGDSLGAPAEPAPSDEPSPSDDSSGGDRPDGARNPFAGFENGRAEERNDPPELSSGDPLATRDTRS